MEPLGNDVPGGIILASPDLHSADTDTSRWGWWLVIAYMFYAQATICDEYLVEAIKVIVSRFQIPEDVAGATLLALACNGPELFTNGIAIFITHSDLGVGTVVGSEIFNLLCIVGAAIVCAPQLPLKVGGAGFSRDCLCYGISIGLLYWVLADEEVTFFESSVLLACCLGYAGLVASTGMIETWFFGKGSSSRKSTQIDVSEPRPRPSVKNKSFNRRCTVASFGVEAEQDLVYVQIGRLGRRAHNSQFRMRCLVFTSSEGVEIRPVGTGKGNDLFDSEEYDSESDLDNTVCASQRLNDPSLLREDSKDSQWSEDSRYSKESLISPPLTTSRTLLQEPLLSGKAGSSSFQKTRSTIQKKGGLTATSSTDKLIKFSDIDLLQAAVHQPELSLGIRDSRFGGKVVAKFSFESMTSKYELEAILERKIKQAKEDQKKISSQISPPMPHDSSSLSFITAFLSRSLAPIQSVLTRPLHFLLHLTLGWCDVRDVKKEDRYLSCFMISMCWLAVFSYLLCAVADIIHVQFEISTATLGITLCAVGTSFPNFYASVLIAMENRSAMAIANALGSNIQNVLLALALPWFAKTYVSGEPYPVAAPGITRGIEWMAGTLLLVVFCAVKGGGKLSKLDGVCMVGAYFVYLGFALHGE